MLWNLLVFAFVIASPVQTLAARNAKVVVNKAKVYEFPRPESKIISTIVSDFPIQVSNFQTNGFFKTSFFVRDIKLIAVGQAAVFVQSIHRNCVL